MEIIMVIGQGLLSKAINDNFEKKGPQRKLSHFENDLLRKRVTLKICHFDVCRFASKIGHFANWSLTNNRHPIFELKVSRKNGHFEN